MNLKKKENLLLNINNTTTNQESYSNKVLIDLKGKFHKENPSKAIKPYSNRVIPKILAKNQKQYRPNLRKKP